jgi:hypothetical protein
MFLQTTITAFQLMFSIGIFAHEILKYLHMKCASKHPNEPLEFEKKHVILQKGIVPGDNLQLMEFELVPPRTG